MTESLALGLGLGGPSATGLSPTPYLPTMLDEKQRTCRTAAFGTFPTRGWAEPGKFISRQFRVDIDTRVGKNRAWCSWSL